LHYAASHIVSCVQLDVITERLVFSRLFPANRLIGRLSAYISVVILCSVDCVITKLLVFSRLFADNRLISRLICLYKRYFALRWSCNNRIIIISPLFAL